MITPTLSEWLNFIVRWVHVFAGIMWVGTTYLSALRNPNPEIKS